MDCRLSVIVPVYNAETTLRRCVDSLRPQMREGDELILVNDGSKDGSAALCAQYAAQDARIRYVSKENGGVSTARNAGLDAAQGKYVIFVDSDDYVSPTLFQDIDAVLQEDDWDLIRFSYCVDDGSRLTNRIMQRFEQDSRPFRESSMIFALRRSILHGRRSTAGKSWSVKGSAFRLALPLQRTVRSTSSIRCLLCDIRFRTGLRIS